MSYSTRGSNGGGGFGGFPYRSAHQQGTDGSNTSNNSRNNTRRKKFQNRQKRGGPITCQIRIQVPVHKRGMIVGRNGTTVKRLTNETKCVFDIPKQNGRNTTTINSSNDEIRQEQNANVIVKASCVAHLLHACWCIANLIFNRNMNDVIVDDEDSAYVKYTMTLQTLPGISIQGILSKPVPCDLYKDIDLDNPQSFMSGTDIGEHCISAYCVHSDRLDRDQVSTLVDNELFMDHSISAAVDVVELTENDGSILIFVYGTAHSKAEHVYKSILSHSLQK